MAALRPLLSCRRSLVLNDLAVIHYPFSGLDFLSKKGQAFRLVFAECVGRQLPGFPVDSVPFVFFSPQVNVGEKLDFGDPTGAVCALVDLFRHQVEAGVKFR